MMLKNNGYNYGYKNLKKKSEEHLIWYKKDSNVHFKNVVKIMDLMYH